jgi:pSer/pThr/pTyr-binding forkhead associated (FHA) protein
MAKPDLYQSCRGFAQSATVEMFEERWPGHFVLGQWPKHGDDRELDFNTGVIELEKPRVRDAAVKGKVDGRGEITTYTPGLSFLIEVKKSARNTWLDWISVGRATNNDVILRHPTVSKLHARFHVEGERDAEGKPRGKHLLTDVKSTFGTRVNGGELEASKPVALKNGDYIMFGKVGCIFLDAPGLYHRLRAMK